MTIAIDGRNGSTKLTDRAEVTRAAASIGDRLRAGDRVFRLKVEAKQSKIKAALDQLESVKLPQPAEVDAPLLVNPEEQIFARFVVVTPAIAESWLQKNQNNRPISVRVVNRYAAIMAAGHWKKNGEAIIFDRNGRMINGQHRLTACVESGYSFTTMVVTGVDPDDFDTLDNGRRRGGTDVLAILNYTNCKTLAAAAYLLAAHENGHLRNNYNLTSAEPSEIRKTVANHPNLPASVEVTKSCKKICPGSVAAFCHYLFAKQSADLADEFFARLADGQGLVKTDPVYLLRNQLVESRDRRTFFNRVKMIALFFKAWNSTKAGKPIYCLRWATGGSTPESFPTIDN